MKNDEQNIGRQEGNSNPNAKGCLISFIPGVTGLLNKINQRKEDYRTRREQFESDEQQRARIIDTAIDHNISAQAAGIYLPEFYNPTDPISTHLFRERFNQRLEEEQSNDLVKVIRIFQEGAQAANPTESTDQSNSDELP